MMSQVEYRCKCHKKNCKPTSQDCQCTAKCRCHCACSIPKCCDFCALDLELTGYMLDRSIEYPACLDHIVWLCLSCVGTAYLKWANGGIELDIWEN